MKFPGLPIKGRLVKDWAKDVISYIRASRITGVSGGRLVRTPNGTIIQITPQSTVPRAAATPCAFGRAIEGSTSSYKTLSAGQIHAAGTHTDDGGEGGTDLTPTDGHFVWAEVVITATEADDLLTGAWSAASATLASGSSVPDDHDWEPGDNVGKAYAPLGYWTGSGATATFTAYACGDVTFKFCAENTISGNATFYRG